MADDFDWTTETIARLRALWLEGHATAEIGRRMQISKNAVVGKAHRLGLPPRPSPIRRDGSDPPRRPATPQVRRPGLPTLPSATESRPAPVPRPPPAPLPAAAAPRPPASQPCCWPIGEPGKPGFRFCDAAAEPRKPYCAEHAGQAYVEPNAARDRPDGRSLNQTLRRELTRTP